VPLVSRAQGADLPKCRGPAVTIRPPRANETLMRLMLAAILALALGLFPVGTARAETASDPSRSMSCHDMMGGAGNMNGDDSAPADNMRDCADHCLSQVNGQTTHARLLGPSFINAIHTELGGALDLGKVHYRDPPDPPPPRL
jgi:hypothetical protein